MEARWNIEILRRTQSVKDRDMSFSSEVKEELRGRIDSAKHCQIAELAAMLAFGGTVIPMPDGKCLLVMTTENELVATKFVELLGKAFGVTQDMIDYDYEGSKNTTIHMSIGDSEIVEQILMAIKWRRMPDDRIIPVFADSLVVQKECCKRAFIKGAFLTAGSISDPNKYYHYEIVCNYEEGAVKLREMFTFFNLEAKITSRKNSFIVYLKEGNHITDCLNVMGAFVSQMELYNVMILKGISNDINRKVNCETANMNKTIEAAVKQIRDIEYIRDTVGLDYLNDSLKQVALVRLENSDMNLKDIGDRLNPPVGKSGVNHRLRKIGEIAEELRSKGV